MVYGCRLEVVSGSRMFGQNARGCCQWGIKAKSGPKALTAVKMAAMIMGIGIRMITTIAVLMTIEKVMIRTTITLVVISRIMMITTMVNVVTGFNTNPQPEAILARAMVS